MQYFLNGYYGYDNAGDEAVLCSVMEAIVAHDSDARFVVTSGDPASTRHRYSREFSIEAVPRQNPKSLIPAIRACDIFVSGGGSLVQDVTSLRNVFYYTGLMRLARIFGKPVVVYAQGVGPLNRKIAQRVARGAFQNAQVLTVRDQASSQLLKKIGVTKTVEVTADPVWALRPAPLAPIQKSQPIWNVALRSWPNVNHIEYSKSTFGAISEAANLSNAHLRFVPMQPSEDAPLAAQMRDILNDSSRDDELVILDRTHPREVMAQCNRGAQVMIAMRLHALIFAAAQGVPCVAINYDPKVEALAKLIDAPLLSIEDLQSSQGANRVLEAIENARALSPERVQEFQNLAAKTAQLAVASAQR